MRVLIVEDEVALARKIAAALIEAGHGPKVVHDRLLGMQEATARSFDLIVVDIGLRRIDGFELLRLLRKHRVTSRILVLTARSQIEDRVTGLQLGADDYLVKPFAMAELIARVNALGRRYPEQRGLTWYVGDLTLDLANLEVRRVGKRIELSSRELALLRVLMRAPGRVFTRTELSERVWQRPHQYDMKLVEVFIGRLRKKLGHPPLIQTMRHVGYSIEPAR